jgi:hypothetical protein
MKIYIIYNFLISRWIENRFQIFCKWCHKFENSRKFLRSFWELKSLGEFFSNFQKSTVLPWLPESKLSSLWAKFYWHSKMLKSPKHLMTFRWLIRILFTESRSRGKTVKLIGQSVKPSKISQKTNHKNVPYQPWNPLKKATSFSYFSRLFSLKVLWHSEGKKRQKFLIL